MELSLEFLMINIYNFDKVNNLIKFRDASFKKFLNGKFTKLNYYIDKKYVQNEVEKIANQNKKTYQ